jgi:hypothetical protein
VAASHPFHTLSGSQPLAPPSSVELASIDRDHSDHTSFGGPDKSLDDTSPSPQVKINEMKDELNTVNKLNLDWGHVSKDIHGRMLAFRGNLNEKLNLLNSKVMYARGKS